MREVSSLRASTLAAERSLTGPAAMLAFATAVVVTTEFIVVGLLPEMARDLDVSVVEAGRFVSWFALSSAILGPPLTIVASGMEPRRVVAVALLVFALGNLAAALVPSYPVIVAVRVFQGAALPVLVSVGSASIAQLAGPGREGQAVALVYLGVVVAIVLAVPAGVVLADHGGWPTSFVSLAILAAIVMAAVSLAGARLMLLLPLLAVWGAAHTAAFLLCQVRVMLAAPSAPAFASSLNIAACNVGMAAGAEAGGWVVDYQGIGAIGFGGAALAAVALALAFAVNMSARTG